MTRLHDVTPRRDFLPTQITHVRYREDPKGHVATVHWNDFGPNGNPVTERSARIESYASTDRRANGLV